MCMKLNLIPKFLLNFKFPCMCVCTHMCGYMHVGAGEYRYFLRSEVSGPQSWSYRCLWVLETKLGSSSRAEHTLNIGTISPAQLYISNFCLCVCLLC